MEASKWFDEDGTYTGEEIPAECVADGTAQGACDEAMAYWREKLDFTVPRKQAIDYVAASGGWEREELEEMSDDEIAEIVLWMACGQIKEDGDWCGLIW